MAFHFANYHLFATRIQGLVITREINGGFNGAPIPFVEG
jgi:hypothetical protein